MQYRVTSCNKVGVRKEGENERVGCPGTRRWINRDVARHRSLACPRLSFFQSGCPEKKTRVAESLSAETTGLQLRLDALSVARLTVRDQHCPLKAITYHDSRAQAGRCHSIAIIFRPTQMDFLGCGNTAFSHECLVYFTL